jgi:hypothetical protein
MDDHTTGSVIFERQLLVLSVGFEGKRVYICNSNKTTRAYTCIRCTKKQAVSRSGPTQRTSYELEYPWGGGV